MGVTPRSWQGHLKVISRSNPRKLKSKGALICLYYTGKNLNQDSANFIFTNLCLAGYRNLQLQADKIAHILNKNIVPCQSTHLKKKAKQHYIYEIIFVNLDIYC